MYPPVLSVDINGGLGVPGPNAVIRFKVRTRNWTEREKKINRTIREIYLTHLVKRKLLPSYNA